MRGFVVYNFSLNIPSYTENVLAFSLGLGLDKFSNKEVLLNLDKMSGYDFCIFLDKDISLAKMLELKGIRLFNSSTAIEICDSKAYTFVALKDKIPMPHTYIPPLSFNSPDFYVPYSYPVVIKECYGSLGSQVYLAKNEEMAQKIISSLNGRPFIIQEYIETSGTDYRLYTVGKKVVASMKRENKKDFRANCELGGVATDFKPTSAMIEIAENSSEILDLDFGGIDILDTPDGPKLLEVNSSAMVNHIQKVTGTNIPSLLLEHIKKSL
ncbi:MAG: RimK family alpha-L-glutamate ligase [Clostridia bacterium]|nr:RimK family alpha-L-glutamate ligase [Clostridia bacterium]